MIGFVRLLRRYARPMSWRQRTGEIERFPGASGLSVPRGPSPTPTTVIERLTDLSASYDAASTGSYAPQAARVWFALNCGCQNRDLLGSLPMMKSLTVGNVLATSAAKAANLPGATRDSVSAFARDG